MAKRFYIVQWYHNRQGWIDVVPLATLKQKQAIRDAEDFCANHRVQTRVTRKPKGWEPGKIRPG
jgi:hypothetical protein